MNFGDNLKHLRKLKKLSQEDLASKVGVSRQSVSKWESSVAYPEMNNILILCKIFKCEITDLISDKLTDIDSFDEEVKMNLVKFESSKQKKMKGISNAIRIISKIGKIAVTIATVCILVVMFFVPTIVKNIDDAPTIVSDANFDSTSEEDIKTISKIKKVIENNSETKIIVTSELGFITMISYMIVIRIILEHLEKLFKNINEGNTPFTLDNVNHIKKIANFMIIAMVISAVGSGIFSSLIEDFTMEIELFDIVEILFIISMAYIFEYGYEIQKDSKGVMYGE